MTFDSIYPLQFQNPMFPSYDNGRFSVTEEGTLIIDSVAKADEGEYVCKGLSIAGSAFAMARLTVRGRIGYSKCRVG